MSKGSTARNLDSVVASLRKAQAGRVAAALSEANARTRLFAGAPPGRFVVMRANMTEHSRHTTMEAATEAMGKLCEPGMFLKVEEWR